MRIQKQLLQDIDTYLKRSKRYRSQSEFIHEAIRLHLIRVEKGDKAAEDELIKKEAVKQLQRRLAES